MGRSQQREQTDKTPSPIEYYLEFKGGSGTFVYYDGEKNVLLDSLELILLDKRNGVTGWSEFHGGRIYSNLISSSNKHVLNVKAGNSKGAVATGLWKDIKAEVKDAGGSFTTFLFALARIGEKLVPVRVALTRAALAEWTQFETDCNPYNGVIFVTRSEEKKRGAVKYYVPKFNLATVSKEDDLKARNFHRDELLPYLDQFVPRVVEETKLDEEPAQEEVV